MDAPRVPSNANDSDRGASNANKGGKILDNDSKETKQGSSLRGACFLNTVTALKRANVTLVCRRGRSGSEGGDGESAEGGELELHDWVLRIR